jgi:hypothetical protein
MQLAYATRHVPDVMLFFIWLAGPVGLIALWRRR